ncbi:diversity-generating retroelement protein Avd [Pectinatus frisingensis]|uniref:diversity-generating retroelement protein Avd n=1 Tax=Pectinatus frisingensis TaxID=865 RepID=UPI0018C64312|nr:diversity-generating retroelement protein Avd [Pectinatus frisingensis]
MALDDLIILSKLEELDAYSDKKLLQYPKYERFVLCAEIRKTLLEIMHLTIRAAKRYYKKTTLQELDIEIDYLRRLIRKSKAMQYIDYHTHEVWVEKVDEIGRMAGGWIISVQNTTQK